MRHCNGVNRFARKEYCYYRFVIWRTYNRIAARQCCP